ncbi:MAG: serine/threonine protein kinase [Deltaproteobacteria bacterium]|nr:serine/threonine protein kinase [Deltaproteobacteria bacterium]
MGFVADDRIATYRVERELGSTTTGVLYQAVHLVLPRRAIIKVMHPSRMQQFAVQLLREACLLEALHHPGIPKVYESGLLEDRRPWFAFEMIEGTPLSERMVDGPMPSVEVATLIRDLAGILEHAHKRGVVHRALRPDQVVVIARARQHCGVAIPDWTEARTHDSPGEATMLPVRAARAYLAPELSRGETADDRADVFSLGVVAYHALTGALPRGTERHPFIPSIERCPEAPPELATLIDQMLSPDRFDRPTCTEIRSDLDWLAEALSIELGLEDDAHAPSASGSLRIRRPRWTPPIEPTTALSPMPGEIQSKSDKRD